MEKSAAYLMGFQAGFGEGLGLEKVAQLIELLEFEPQNAEQTLEFLRKNASVIDWLKALNPKSVLAKLKASRAGAVVGKPVAKPISRWRNGPGSQAAVSTIPTSLGVAAKGQKAKRTIDLPGVRGTTAVERKAKGPRV
jgi:hypothetical protein